MNLNEISGQRQLTFMKHFDYVREAGTDGELRAAAAIQKELESFGQENRQEAFSFEACRATEVTFTVTEPYEKTYRAAAYVHPAFVASGACMPDGGIEAPFYYAENGDPISLKKAAGKIVMVNFPMDAEMYEKLAKAGAAAFLTITGTPIDQGGDLIPWDRTLRGVEKPAIFGGIVHHVDAIEMVTKGACRARLCIRQQMQTVHSNNVVARIEGTDKAEEILTLTAHYDSVPAGKGAYDNMAGGAIIMEICRYLKAHRPRRSVEFVWLGAEEKGLKGSLAYVEAHEDALEKHMFNMNVDLAGQLVGGTVLGVAAEAETCRALESMAEEIGLGMRTINGIWGSDSNTFAWKGIPAMTLNRDGFGMHTCHDTIELISPWSLQRSAQLLGYIADTLANADEIPFPRSVPADLKEKLDGYFAR